MSNRFSKEPGIEVGDRVYDDNAGRWTKVTSIDTKENSLDLEGGGAMGIEDVVDVLLPSEAEREPARRAPQTAVAPEPGLDP